MGQRLNLEIKHKNKLLVNAYYHWSGYTSSSMALTRIALIAHKALKRDGHQVDKKYATLLLAATGARINDIENQKNYAAKYLFTDEELKYLSEDVDRNRGLISLRPIYSKQTRRFEEARVTIHLDRETINFNALFWEGTTEEFEKEHGRGSTKKLPKCNWDIQRIPIDDFENFMEFIGSLSDGMFISGKRVYSVIE